jgi:hypothetical protein
MSVTANTTYTASFPKRPNIMGAPNQVFKFDNFLDHLIGGIKANTCQRPLINVPYKRTFGAPEALDV